MRDGLPAQDGPDATALPMAARRDRPLPPALWRGIFDDTTRAPGEIGHVFCRADDPAWARQAVGEIVARGRLPLLTVEPWAWPTDGEVAAMAAAIRACGQRPVWLRYGHEMNGDWYPWSADPARYAAEWGRWFGAMPGNVRSVWCPNCQPVAGLERWLPGSGVDVVGVDGYARGPELSFGDVFGPVLDEVRRLVPGRPLAVCETACPRGPRQRRWVEGMWAWIAHRAPEIDAVVWFGKSKEADWRLGPAARRAFLGREGR